MNTSVPTTKNCPAQNVRSAKIKKSCFQERPRGGKSGLITSEGVLQEQEKETDRADEMFSTIPAGSQSRKKQDRGITNRITDRTYQ